MQTNPATYPAQFRPALAGMVLLMLMGAVPVAAQPSGWDSLAPPLPAFVGEPGQLPSPPAARRPAPSPGQVTTAIAAAPAGTDGAGPVEQDAPAGIRFPAGSDILTPEAARLLDRMAARLLSNPAERLELRAHAPPSGHGEGAARRLSLARALAVRSYLLERGVEKHRLIVYALGSRGLEKPAVPGQMPPGADRVELSVTP